MRRRRRSQEGRKSRNVSIQALCWNKQCPSANDFLLFMSKCPSHPSSCPSSLWWPQPRLWLGFVIIVVRFICVCVSVCKKISIMFKNKGNSLMCVLVSCSCSNKLTQTE